jgi:hypothetical protein
VAQTSDDKRDVAMIGAISRLASWWKESQPELPMLPLPSQDDSWVPQVSRFDLADVVDGKVE